MIFPSLYSCWMWIRVPRWTSTSVCWSWSVLHHPCQLLKCYRMCPYYMQNWVSTFRSADLFQWLSLVSRIPPVTLTHLSAARYVFAQQLSAFSLPEITCLSLFLSLKRFYLTLWCLKYLSNTTFPTVPLWPIQRFYSFPLYLTMISSTTRTSENPQTEKHWKEHRKMYFKNRFQLRKSKQYV